jgi:prepilin-type N-terminal cleavage/methylation domain-containing protein
MRGFSLLEILIAITLLAFITLGVINVTDNAVSTMERTSEINKNNLQIETALSRLEWDFSQIYSPLYFSTSFNLNQMTNQTPNNSGVNSVSPEYMNYIENLKNRFEQNQNFSGISQEGLPIPRFVSSSKETFEFFTSSNRRKIENSKQSHFAWVRYTLVTQEDEQKNENTNEKIPQNLKSFVRYFYADDPYSPERIDPDSDKIKGAILLKNVESLEFQYWEPTKKRWEDNLRSINGGENLIRGLKILISWYDDSGNKRQIEKVFRTLWPLVSPNDQTTTQPNSNNVNTNTNTPTENNNETSN